MIEFGMLKKNMWLILIIMLASVLRFVKLDYLELFGDEIDAGYQAYSLMTTGKDYKGHTLPLYAQSFSEWRAPMMMYFMIPFIKIFGLNEFGVRMMPATFGIINIVIFYFLLIKLGFKKNIALLSTFAISILPWHIQYSRSAFEITLMSSLILLGLYFLILVIEKDKIRYSLLSALFFCLSLYTYNTSNIYVPLLSLLILFVYKKINKSFFVFILISFIFCLPLLGQILFGNATDRFGKVSVFNDKNTIAEIIDYRNKSENKLLAKIFYNKPIFFTKKIVSNYLNSFSADFLFGQGDVTFRHSLHRVGNLFWIYSILIITGLALIIRQKDQNNANKFILGMLLIAPIPASLTNDGYFHATRLFLMIFPLCIIAAIGLFNIFNNKKLFLVPIILIMLFEFLNYQNYYWNHYKNESWRWWHSGYKDLVSKIDAYDNKYLMVYIENTYEPSLIRYLFWTKYKPDFNINDSMVENGCGKLNGFLLNNKTCFVNYKGIVNSDMLNDDSLYVISQSVNAGTDNWNINTPSNIKVIDTVYNPINEVVFYLISKDTK